METRNDSASLGERLDQLISKKIWIVGEGIDIVTYWAAKAFWWYVGALGTALFVAALLRAAMQIL